MTLCPCPQTWLTGLMVNHHFRVRVVGVHVRIRPQLLGQRLLASLSRFHADTFLSASGRPRSGVEHNDLQLRAAGCAACCGETGSGQRCRPRSNCLSRFDMFEGAGGLPSSLGTNWIKPFPSRLVPWTASILTPASPRIAPRRKSPGVSCTVTLNSTAITPFHPFASGLRSVPSGCG
jgi:hypothetical protein